MLLNEVSLSGSFDAVYSSSIKNVSTALASLIHHANASSIDSLPSTTKYLTIPDDLWYNETRFSRILSRFSELEELDIGDRSMKVITKFDLNGLSSLKKLRIGKSSFTNAANSYGYDPIRSFEVTECPALQSISIGDYSFSDYGSILRIENCSLLESIHFGKLSFVNIREVHLKSIVSEYRY